MLAKDTRSAELLFAHPTALRELQAQSEPVLVERRFAAQAALDALTSGLALPSDAHRMTLAVADLEWLLRELRLLRRTGPQGYRSAHPPRPDPLPGPLEQTLRSYVAQPPAARLGKAMEVVSIRYGLQELRTYLMGSTERVSAGPRDQIGAGGCKVVQAFGRPVAVYELDGALYALEDVCPHRGAPLSKGRVARGSVICPLHAWQFNLQTGKLLGHDNLSVRTFEVLVEDGEVFVLPGPAR